MPQSKKETIEMTALKKELSEKIIKEYGSIKDFIDSDYAKKHHIGNSIRVYLSPKGGVSLELFKELCNHFKLGKLERKLEIVRTTTYTLTKI